MIKLFLGIPVYKYIEPETEETILSKIYGVSHVYQIGDYCRLRGSPNIYAQRFNLVKRFLKTNCDYFLYFDADQVIVEPNNAIDLMLKDNKDILSPLIVRKFFPHIPTCLTFERKRALDKGSDLAYFEDFRQLPILCQVHYCCGGMVLIKRRVLEQVDKPFYPLFNERDELLSTDYAFFKKAKVKGFSCWIDQRIKVAHLGMYGFLPEDYYGLLDSGQLSVEKVGDNYVYELRKGEAV